MAKSEMLKTIHESHTMGIDFAKGTNHPYALCTICFECGCHSPEALLTTCDDISWLFRPTE